MAKTLPERELLKQLKRLTRICEKMFDKHLEVQISAIADARKRVTGPNFNGTARLKRDFIAETKESRRIIEWAEGI